MCYNIINNNNNNTAIGFSLSSSSPYNRTDKTKNVHERNNTKHSANNTKHSKYKNTVKIIIITIITGLYKPCT